MKDRCAYCKAPVPRGYRRTLRIDRSKLPHTFGKAKKNAKTFYHYACAVWKKRGVK